jgi:hypothetical protein
MLSRVFQKLEFFYTTRRMALADAGAVEEAIELEEA